MLPYVIVNVCLRVMSFGREKCVEKCVRACARVPCGCVQNKPAANWTKSDGRCPSDDVLSLSRVPSVNQSMPTPTPTHANQTDTIALDKRLTKIESQLNEVRVHVTVVSFVMRSATDHFIPFPPYDPGNKLG